MQTTKKQKILAGLTGLFLLQNILAACSGLEAIPNNFEGDESINSSPNNTTEILNNQTDFNQDLREFVEQAMAEDGLPGVAIAIVSRDKIIFAEGFGLRDVENQLPVTSATLFHIGSTQKSITAMMIATLVDQGLFDWDTPVIEIYPDFELSSDEATETVTMRHLLSMQSGIPEDAEEDFAVDEASGEDLFKYVANVTLLGQPGEEFSYSNISASLAGYLGAIAAGEAQPNLYSGYENLLRQKILDPIGMNMAMMRVTETKQNPNYGKSYVMENGAAIEAEPEDFDEDPLAPSGGMKANIIEMANYIGTQLNRGQAPNGKQVVSKANLVETWQPNLENYGMGWESSEYDGVVLLSHEGSFDNYLSVIGFLPDFDIGFVVLTNSAEAGERLVAEWPAFFVDQMMVDF